jgi:HAD superfamily hydrolase (TIGR01490 family)
MNPPAAAFFDVDETLISVKSMLRFLEFYWRARGRPATDYPDAMNRLHALTEQGRPRSEANRAFYRLFAGEDQTTVAQCGHEWFQAASTHADFWNRAAVSALRRHAAAGHLTVLVSGSFRPCLDPIAAALDVDLVLCTELQILHGHYTGALVTPLIGDAKAAGARRVMRDRRLDPARCHAYGDHSSDLPLLREVGHPVAVGDDPLLLEHAESAGWGRLP